MPLTNVPSPCSCPTHADIHYLPAAPRGNTVPVLPLQYRPERNAFQPACRLHIQGGVRHHRQRLQPQAPGVSQASWHTPSRSTTPPPQHTASPLHHQHRHKLHHASPPCRLPPGRDGTEGVLGDEVRLIGLEPKMEELVRSGDVKAANIRSHVSWTLGCCNRGDETRQVNVTHLLRPVRMWGAGPSPCFVLPAVLHGGKVNQVSNSLYPPPKQVVAPSTAIRLPDMLLFYSLLLYS